MQQQSQQQSGRGPLPAGPGPTVPRMPAAELGTSGPAAPTKVYPPRLTVGFDYTPPAAAAVRQSLTQRLESCSGLRRLGPIEVSLEGRTATLRGKVASERDRTLAQSLLLFEPGISQVKNELAVGSPRKAP